MSALSLTNVVSALFAHPTKSSIAVREKLDRTITRRKTMLGVIAAVLIVLWLLGFFAFHVTSAFIHVALVVGVILLLVHFMRGRTASV
jgi:uncharacterized membrane protein